MIETMKAAEEMRVLTNPARNQSVIKMVLKGTWRAVIKLLGCICTLVFFLCACDTYNYPIEFYYLFFTSILRKALLYGL